MTIPNVSHGLINGITPNVEWRRWFESLDRTTAQNTQTVIDQTAAIAAINAEIVAIESAIAATSDSAKPAQILARISLGF